MLSKKSLSSLLAVMSAFLLCSAIPTQVQAQSLSQEDLKAALLNIKNVSEKNLNDALRMYLELRSQIEGPEIDYSIGRTYQRMFQCESAQDFYMRVMMNYPDFTKVIEYFDEIATCTEWQKVTVNCTASSDDILVIDSTKVGTCWSRPYTLPDGEHTIKLVNTKTGKIKSIDFNAKSGEPAATIDIAFDVEPTEEICGEYVSVNHPPQVIEKETRIEYKDRFNPALYWGLISGGVLVLAGGTGWSAAMLNNATVDVQKYEDLFTSTKDDAYKKKADDARDKTKTAKALMYASLGVGGALAASGIALAIVSAVSPKEQVEESNIVSAFVTPNDGGAMMGVGLSF